MKISLTEICIFIFYKVKDSVGDFFNFVKRIKIKGLLFYFASLIIGFVYYCNSVHQFAYHALFGIDYSFFTVTKEMEYWNALFIFLDVLKKIDFITMLKLVLLALLCLIPFYGADSCIKDGNRISAYFIYFISSFLSLFIMLIFFLVTDLFISQTQDRYVAGHSEYCQIINHKSLNEQLVILENPTVPYKLILQNTYSESLGIYYFKPNEPLALWHTFESKELKKISLICNRSKS